MADSLSHRWSAPRSLGWFLLRLLLGRFPWSAKVKPHPDETWLEGDTPGGGWGDGCWLNLAAGGWVAWENTWAILGQHANRKDAGQYVIVIVDYPAFFCLEVASQVWLPTWSPRRWFKHVDFVGSWDNHHMDIIGSLSIATCHFCWWSQEVNAKSHFCPEKPRLEVWIPLNSHFRWLKSPSTVTFHDTSPAHDFRAGGVRVARDKLRFLEEGGVKRFAPEPLGGHDRVTGGLDLKMGPSIPPKHREMLRNHGGFGEKPWRFRSDYCIFRDNVIMVSWGSGWGWSLLVASIEPPSHTSFLVIIYIY